MATYVTSRLRSQIVNPQVDPEYISVEIWFHCNKQLVIRNLYSPPSTHSESIKCILSTIGPFIVHPN